MPANIILSIPCLHLIYLIVGHLICCYKNGGLPNEVTHVHMCTLQKIWVINPKSSFAFLLFYQWQDIEDKRSRFTHFISLNCLLISHFLWQIFSLSFFRWNSICLVGWSCQRKTSLLGRINSRNPTMCMRSRRKLCGSEIFL